MKKMPGIPEFAMDEEKARACVETTFNHRGPFEGQDSQEEKGNYAHQFRTAYVPRGVIGGIKSAATKKTEET